MSDEIEKALKNTGDALKEGGHRLEAEGERGKREIAGDAMTPGEKLGSVGKEIVADGKAEVDKLKRETR